MAGRNGGKRPGTAAFGAKDEQLALGLAQGMTRTEAARYAGMGERTAYTRLRDPAFRTLVQESRDRIVGQTVGKLVAAGAKSCTKLVALLDDPSATIRLQAARTLIEMTVRLGSYGELVERIAQLEARVDSSKPKGWG